MAEDDFIQEEYEPKTNNNTYIESIKFNDEFTTKSTSSEKPIQEKNDIFKSKMTSKEISKPKINNERKEEYVQKKLIKPTAEKSAAPKKEHEKPIIKKKPVQNKINPKPIVKKEEDDTINLNFNFMKKLKNFLSKQDKSNLILTVIALIAIFGLALLILNLDKIFPDKGYPVAFVNGEQITTKDVENTLKTVPAVYRGLITDEEILNQTIINKLLLQESAKLSLTATDSEVELAIDKTLATAQMSKNDFKAYLAEQNITYDDMKIFYKNNLIIEKLLQQTAYVGINVTQKEIKDFYKNNSEKIGNLTLEDVEEQIEAFLLQQKKADSLKVYVADLMAKADIRVISQDTSSVVTSETNFSSADVEKYASCATKNGLDKKTVIFLYSDSCPHCQKMKPIITELQSENYNFKWASVSDNEMRNILSECYSDVLAGGVPQFICAKNGQTIVGEKSKETMAEFAKSCNQ